MEANKDISVLFNLIFTSTLSAAKYYTGASRKLEVRNYKMHKKNLSYLV